MAEQEDAIVIKDVYKTFKLPHEQHSGIKQAFVNIFNRKAGYETQQALGGISFEIKKGDFFGIVGRNGSGKSTLLKLIAGIYAPDSGLVQVNGSLTPFIELGVGFNPELTGRENVFLNGALLGFSKKEMEEMYGDIVSFAELEQFMDQKLKNYSSGMQVRLAFSVAIRAQSDILLLDEVLAVGDEAFQRKCFAYFKQLKDNKKTVVLVTHSMETVEQFCNRAMLVESGKITKIGDSSKVAQRYSDINVMQRHKKEKSSDTAAVSESSSYNKGLKVSVSAQDQDGEPLMVLRPENKLIVAVELVSKQDIDSLAMGMLIYNSQNIAIFATNTSTEKTDISLKKGRPVKLVYTIDNVFSNDNYRVAVSLKNKSKTEVYFSDNQVADFVSTGRKHSYAVANPAFTSEVISKG